MKNVLILNYEYPPIGGGAGVMTQYLATGLAKKGLGITVLSTWFDGTPEVEENGSLKIIRIKSKRKASYRSNPIEMLDWMRKAIKFARAYCAENKVDLVVCNFTMPGGVVGYSLFKKFKTPYIILSHGHDVPWFYPGKMFFYHLFLYPLIYLVSVKSSALVSLTKKLKKNADNLTGKPDRNKVIPNGINTGLFVNSEPPSGVFTLLFVGRLEDQKDPMTFLKALNLVKDKIPFNAILLGDGALRQSLEAFISKNNLRAFVEVKGKQPYNAMPAFYAAAHVYVMTSLHEGMPLALIEAACTGKYVISTPVSGSDELVFEGKNGLLVEYRNEQQVADAIVEAYNKFKQGNVLVNAQTVDEIRSEFNTESLIGKYYSLIQDVCKNN